MSYVTEWRCVTRRIEKTMRHWQKFHDSHQRLNDWLKMNEDKVVYLKTDGATFAVIKEAIRNVEVYFTNSDPYVFHDRMSHPL